MSSIRFDSAEGSVEIGGRERARMGVLIDDIAWKMHSRGMNFYSIQREEGLLRLDYLFSSGKDNFAERLGWVCLIGNDVMKLLAHIHGQCEIHGWVHPDDGEWFASLIEEGIATGLLGEDGREFYGSWQEVADLARKSTTPLVSSYSVCEYWPDPYLISETCPDLFKVDLDDKELDAWEEWEALGETEQNRIGDLAIEFCAPRWWPEEWGTHWSDAVRDRRPYAEDNSGVAKQ